ncbi:DUF4307 domain-containing protein [Microbacterium aquimaris]|uniref:DUF4307 domain-containing protein n=1 Tax=Microbacterium aquimaris TaxID=459816 RepID=A0ABU5N6Z2_9MICO|nr:DUF4307 domain-containing protein [Microbacterium aquimaris]MDZ8161857.1 DUF4307 domain-containing protein [Microbacterium aquimaris]
MTTPDELDDRYGRTPSRRRRLVATLAIGVGAVAAGAIAWGAVSNVLDDVDVETVAFDVVDEHSVSLSFQVAAPAGRDIACALEARDPDHGVVGWKIVEYPASTQHTIAVREVIPTLAEATTGFVNSCWVT